MTAPPATLGSFYYHPLVNKYFPYPPAAPTPPPSTVPRPHLSFLKAQTPELQKLALFRERTSQRISKNEEDEEELQRRRLHPYKPVSMGIKYGHKYWNCHSDVLAICQDEQERVFVGCRDGNIHQLDGLQLAKDKKKYHAKLSRRARKVEPYITAAVKQIYNRRNRLVVVGDDGQIAMWNITDGIDNAQRKAYFLEAQDSGILGVARRIAVDMDNEYIFVCSAKGGNVVDLKAELIYIDQHIGEDSISVYSFSSIIPMRSIPVTHAPVVRCSYANTTLTTHSVDLEWKGAEWLSTYS